MTTEQSQTIPANPEAHLSQATDAPEVALLSAHLNKLDEYQHQPSVTYSITRLPSPLAWGHRFTDTEDTSHFLCTSSSSRVPLTCVIVGTITRIVLSSVDQRAERRRAVLVIRPWVQEIAKAWGRLSHDWSQPKAASALDVSGLVRFVSVPDERSVPVQVFQMAADSGTPLQDQNWEQERLKLIDLDEGDVVAVKARVRKMGLEPQSRGGDHYRPFLEMKIVYRL